MIIEKEKFLNWMELAKWVLPPSMTLEEARILFERKIKEEEELNDYK